MTPSYDHLARAFRAAAERHAPRVATRIKTGDGYAEQTFGALAAQVRDVAAALHEWGIQAGDRVVILSNNRPEWTATDFACYSVGAVVVPIFPSSTPDQIAYIIKDSGARVVVIDGQREADKLARVTDCLQGVDLLTSFDAVTGILATPWAELQSPSDTARRAIDARVAQADPAEIATIIYTSGTTGDPKGVVLQHQAITSEIEGLNAIFTLRPEDHSLAFLPLSHALERGWSTYIMLQGCANTYVHDPKSIADAMVEVRPTLFVTVPALFEKVLATARERVADSALKRRLFEWATGLGMALQHDYRRGVRPPLWKRAQLPVADTLVLRSVRNAVGGRKTVLACGGAPLRPQVEEFFAACGLPICSGYGLTEAAPLVSFNAPGAFKVGSAGRVMPGGELRIGADGEILYQGPNVMREYWHAPEATAEAFTADGFLRTGDVGEIDEHGFLTITDRLKDLLVTSNGKNIAPQPIEGLVLADPLFQHAVALGDNRPVVTLLVSPSFPHLEKLAEQLQVRWDNRDELLSQPQILEAIRQRLEKATAKLPNHEQIKDFRLLVEDFTQENGLLTPTLKVRRREVEKRFAAVIDEMYAKLAELRKAARK